MILKKKQLHFDQMFLLCNVYRTQIQIEYVCENTSQHKIGPSSVVNDSDSIFIALLANR